MNEHAQCQELLASLSDYVDGSLSKELCAELERHLSECENCRVVVNTTRKTIELYKSMDEPGPLPVEVRERLFRRLDLHDFMHQ